MLVTRALDETYIFDPLTGHTRNLKIDSGDDALFSLCTLHSLVVGRGCCYNENKAFRGDEAKLNGGGYLKRDIYSNNSCRYILSILSRAIFVMNN